MTPERIAEIEARLRAYSENGFGGDHRSCSDYLFELPAEMLELLSHVKEQENRFRQLEGKYRVLVKAIDDMDAPERQP